MIKRRKDYEVYCRCRVAWHQAWQVFGKVYAVYLLLHPEFLKFCHEWRGRRIRTFWLYLKKPFYLLGETRPESEVWADEMECRKTINWCKREMVKQMAG